MAKASIIRVLVVDDHYVVRRGLIAFLNATEGIQVVGEADSGEVAIDMCSKHSLDVVLMDVVLPGKDGVETCAEIRNHFPSVAVLMLSSFSDTAMVRRALDVGAGGFLLKDALPQQIIDAIHTVHGGASIIASELTAALLTSPQPKVEFKPREQEVLRLMAKGMTNQQISYELDISYATVKYYVSEILSKSNTASRTEAVAFAMENRLL